MAERYNGDGSQDTSAAENAAEDLSVLFPDHTIIIADQSIRVTEYPFIKWLELKPLCSGLIAELAMLSGQDQIEVDEIFECFENHFDVMKTLFCESIHKDISFLSKLSDTDIQMLMLTWWGVNKHFFLRSAKRILRKTNQQSDGQTSSSA